MSTPAGAGPSDSKDVDRRRSLGKYVKRMSSVFRKEKPTKSSASGSGSGPAGATPATAPTTTTKAEEQESAKPKEDITPTTTATPAPAPTKIPPPVATTQQLNRSAMQQDRARALFEKYGLTLESHEWITTNPGPISVQRIEKPIRMRVHRSCHHCGTTYGSAKICVNCEHKRCKKCPRYPRKRTPAEKAEKEKLAEEAGEKPKKKKKLLSIPTKTGGELVYQSPRQRVRRSCHKCNNLFIPATSTVCDHCRHIRCTKCPREPAKLSKWPSGYPGDAPGEDVEAESETEVEKELQKFRRTWRKPRQRVRWECEECHGTFLNGSPLCPSCGHERCEKCIRTPLKKIKKDQDEKDFDPEVVAAVEAKLRALTVERHPPTKTETS